MTQRLVTLPYLTFRLQRPLRHVEGAVSTLKIEPAFIVNNEVAYYAAEIEEQLADHFDELEIQCLQREREQRHKKS